MNNMEDILHRVLLNMKYDSKMTLKENYNVVLVEQSAKVGDYIVTYEKEYNRIRIDSPTGKTYYWTPSDGKWSRIEFNDQYVDLDSTKDKNAISVLSNVFKKSGIGSVFYIKNTDQGNKFRSWIINKDPEFAKTINLSPKGAYDNEYIRKAWVKYGQQYKDHLKQIKSEKATEELKPTIDFLKSNGLDPSGAISNNHAFALAAIRATKKLTDKIQQRIVGAGDSAYSVCVKKVGSTCPPGSYMTVDSFNLSMANKVNSKKDENAQGLKPPQYTFLTNFYFDWGKIQKDLNDTFKLDKNAYRSELFPDGWWNWFTTYWGTDNLSQIKIADYPKLVKVPGWKGGYPTGEMTSSDMHTFLTIVEIGTLILGLIPSPLSPILLGVSTAAGLGDSATYFYEGDKYMGSMMLALEIIPGGEFLKVLRGSKTAVKLGKEGTLELLEKGAKGELETTQKVVYQNLKKELGVIEKEITQGVEKQISKNVTKNIPSNFLKEVSKLSPKESLKKFYQTMSWIINSFKKEFPVGTIPKMLINVGGTMVGIDKLYLAVFGRDEDRQNSDIRKLYYLIQQKGLPEAEEQARVLEEQLSKVSQENIASNMLEFGTEEELDRSAEKWFGGKQQIGKPNETTKTDNIKDEELFGKLEPVQDDKITLKPKSTKEVLNDFEFEKLERDKDNYDFYIWSERFKKWNPINFDKFNEVGRKGHNRVTYSPKIQK
jgi:hypothetical protein